MLFASVILAVLIGDAAAAQTPHAIDRLAWLHGCWELSTADRTVEEMWTVPRGGSMLGLSRTVRDGKLVAYEMVVLREDGQRLSYTGHPSGQPSATFRSTTLSSSEVVFENAEHDFPQQIGYRVDGETLLAWIAGSRNGKATRVEFPYKRVACTGR